VTNSEPFQRTAEVGVKFEPYTVNVNCGPPGAAVEGLKDDNTGAGVAEIEKLKPLDVEPPGLATVMVAVPAVVINVEGTVAVTWVGLR